MAKSADCVDNNHGKCQGHFKEEMNGAQVTRMCACACHDSTYQLVRNTVALIAQAERQNPYQLAQASYEGDDGRPL